MQLHFYFSTWQKPVVQFLLNFLFQIFIDSNSLLSVYNVALFFSLGQDHLWRIAQRTAVLPLGRGAFTLSTIHTLLTEVICYLQQELDMVLITCNYYLMIYILSEILQAFTVPKLVLAGRLPSQQNAIVCKIVVMVYQGDHYKFETCYLL